MATLEHLERQAARSAAAGPSPWWLVLPPVFWPAAVGAGVAVTAGQRAVSNAASAAASAASSAASGFIASASAGAVDVLGAASSPIAETASTIRTLAITGTIVLGLVAVIVLAVVVRRSLA